MPSSYPPPNDAERPAVRVRIEGTSIPNAERTFTERFSIGRGMQATLLVDSGRVSRVHVEVAREDGRWVLRDAESTNGTYHNGARIERVELGAETTVRLGKEGPFVYLSVDAAPKPVLPEPEAAPPAFAERVTKRARQRERPPEPATDWSPSDEASGPTPTESARTEPGYAAEMSEPPDASADPGSVSQVIRRYFEEEGAGEPAGERTMMIRQAFQEVQQQQQLAYGKVVAGVAVLLLCALGFAIWQQTRLEHLSGLAETLFYEMKEQDLRTAQTLSAVEVEGNEELAVLLEEQAEAGRRMARRYAGYVEEHGLYRALSDEEKEIYRVARIFNESEFAIPAGFIRAVREYIGYWQSTRRFETAVRRAENNGYTPVIVDAFQRHGLPPEFFYLAMQESDFVAERVGPWTRFGHAKGMWQFIPSTGQAYGLATGPREDLGVYDPQDERHDFERSTEAAARYLADIYTELAQASGLLAMASYNWGEHRVVPKLNRLQAGAQQDFFAGLGETPQQRSYWRFLNQYEERMPEETKNYVLYIFSAAVIGQNPRLFGFDFDNPLQRYIEQASPLARAPLTRP